MEKNLYEELGLKKNATKSEIKSSYRSLVKLHHPDAGGEKERFLAIQNAWETLNDPIKSGETDEWQDWLVDDNMDQELVISQKQEYDDKKELLNSSMKILNQREKEIITARRLNENPVTLEELSKKYKISRERIRQIETKAFEKLQKSMINASKSKNLLPVN